MRKMRPDEIELIGRAMNRRPPVLMSKYGQADRDFTKGDPVSIPTPWTEPDGRSVGMRCQCTLVPPQEETIDQIRRMIDHLPENHFCEQTEGECQILMDLLISDWAKKFLIQMVKEKEHG